MDFVTATCTRIKSSHLVLLYSSAKILPISMKTEILPASRIFPLDVLIFNAHLSNAFLGVALQLQESRHRMLVILRSAVHLLLHLKLRPIHADREKSPLPFGWERVSIAILVLPFILPRYPCTEYFPRNDHPCILYRLEIEMGAYYDQTGRVSRVTHKINGLGCA